MIMSEVDASPRTDVGKTDDLVEMERNIRRLQEQAKDMPIVDKELYFVIEEKTNSVDLTDKGIDMLAGESEDKDFFIMPDLGTVLADVEKSNLSDEDKVREKDKILQDYSVKSERIHSLQQLLKAFTLFEKDVDML